jgi:hypothetical protein
MQRYRQNTIYQVACLLGSKWGKTHLRASVKSKNFLGATQERKLKKGRGGEGSTGKRKGDGGEGKGGMGKEGKGNGKGREGRGKKGGEKRGKGRAGKWKEREVGGKSASWSLGGWTPLLTTT